MPLPEAERALMPHQASRLLVVEDDRLVLASVADGLAQAGYSVSRAETGEGAIRICSEQPPDLVIMDIRLPGMSGIEAAGKIHEKSAVPVIFLSAFDDEKIVKQALAEGGLTYLVKPVRMDQLIASVKAALARAADIRALKAVEENLGIALKGDRNTSVALGIVMERHRLSAAEAFELLRERARAQRLKVSEVAEQLVAAAEALNWRGGTSE